MAYSLATSYAGESLLSGFNWHNGADLSNGYVQYQSQEDAFDLGLYSVDPFSNAVRLGVDSSNTYAPGEGRPSIRLESKESYQHGLFIADFLHMPPSQCGTWPAFWAYGSNWPTDGEVDIIEGANLAYSNIISGHTADGCFLDPADENLFSGERRNIDCAVGTQNIGCGFNPLASDTSSYGDAFNAANGGVYAMEWDSDYIRLWHFPRGAIPADIEAKKPDPKKWGLPQALLGGSKCDVDTFYSNMNIVININFCGDYGAGTWENYPTCAGLAQTCAEYVGSNPQDFENTYWDVNYIDVYSSTGSSDDSAEETDNIFDDDGAGSPESTADLEASSVPPVIPKSEENDAAGTTTSPGLDVSDAPFATATPLKNQTSTSEELTTTTTMTSYMTSTIMVTIPGSGTDSATVSPLPVVTGGAPTNPNQIGDYSYLGCFGSRNGFQTFGQADQSGDMDLEKCIEACNGKTYAGVYDETCYCADELDTDTRAVARESDCNNVCPGNDSQLCGGLVAQRARKMLRWLRRDAPSNVLLSVYASISDVEDPELPPAIGPLGPNTTGSGNGSGSGSRSSQTAAAAAVTTTVTYMTILPSDPGVLVPQEITATLWYENCGCANPKLLDLPMETKVMECNACGAQGQNTVTLTIPLATVGPEPTKQAIEVDSPTAPHRTLTSERVITLESANRPGTTAHFSPAGHSPADHSPASNTTANGNHPVIPTPSAPDQPIVVEGTAWSTAKGMKLSITLSVVVGVTFTIML